MRLKRRKNQNKNLFSLLITLLLFMGIGYAYISSQVFMSGTATAQKQKWNIELTNLTIDQDSTATTESIKLIDRKLEGHFTASLNSIDDYYSFYFDIENNGTIDAMLSNIELKGLSESEKENIDYTINYYNGETINTNDKLPVDDFETIELKVKYKDTSTITSGSYNLSFNIQYNQSNENSVDRGTSLISMMKNQAIINNTIDFTKPSVLNENLNGEGLNIIENTENDSYPIYYYRGNINNNNLIFSGFCWKIVRSTENGGTKLIYNGNADENGYCTNAGDNTEIKKISFSSRNTIPADIGYMYGKVYNTGHFSTEEMQAEYVFGNDVEYDGTNYKLIDTVKLSSDWATDYLKTADKKHYTCKKVDETATCSNVYFVNYVDANHAEYIILTNGEKIENAWENMFQNNTDSNPKKEVESWFENNLANRLAMIEDEVYCNDRYVAKGKWEKDSDSTIFIRFDSRNRLVAEEANPSLQCLNQSDKFTVSSNLGNGKNKYPVGLLTLDELTFGGLSVKTGTHNNYLYNGSKWWTMTPAGDSMYLDEKHFFAVFALDDYEGKIITHSISNIFGLRPVISLKRGTKIASGTGLANDPYIVN